MLSVNTTGLSEAAQSKLQSVFKCYPKIKEVVLYGSRAKGNYKTASDIDLTIKGDQMDLSEFLRIQNDIDDLLLPYKIDLSVFSDLDNDDLKDHIQRVGLEFYKASEGI